MSKYIDGFIERYFHDDEKEMEERARKAQEDNGEYSG